MVEKIVHFIAFSQAPSVLDFPLKSYLIMQLYVWR
jgi:hypothetical protein